MNRNKITVKDGFRFAVGAILATIVFYLIIAAIAAIVGVGFLM